MLVNLIQYYHKNAPASTGAFVISISVIAHYGMPLPPAAPYTWPVE